MAWGLGVGEMDPLYTAPQGSTYEAASGSNAKLRIPQLSPHFWLLELQATPESHLPNMSPEEIQKDILELRSLTELAKRTRVKNALLSEVARLERELKGREPAPVRLSPEPKAQEKVAEKEKVTEVKEVKPLLPLVRLTNYGFVPFSVFGRTIREETYSSLRPEHQVCQNLRQL